MWYRIAEPRQHSVFLGRAHYRHRLHVPLEEHLLVMAPPRTYKTAFLADVILRYPGPVIATTTKPDIFTVRAELHPDHVRVEAEDLGGPWHRRQPDGRPHGLDVVRSPHRPGWLGHRDHHRRRPGRLGAPRPGGGGVSAATSVA